MGQLAPELLFSLKKVATIESLGSSTRIEGSKLTDNDFEVLLSNLEMQKFETRDEQEAAGYSSVMNLLYQSYTYIPLSENYIRQLHSVLLQHSEKDYWHGSNYKKSPNHVEAFDAKGKSLGVVFETASPFETSLRMRDLVEWAGQAYADKKLHPLLITAIVIFDFLAIHPFQDGTGRISRVPITYPFLREGYHYVSYSSLETVVGQSKEGYYLALRQTQGTLKTENPVWQPWVLFFLHALRHQKKRLEAKVERKNLLLLQLPELSLQILQFVKSRGKATISDIVTVTNANRNTIKKHLETLVDRNRLQKNGVGKGTWYSV